MKKTTSKKLSEKLAKYGALTLAVAGVADASGQIVYTDVDPDFNGATDDEYFVDLNGDGTDDFRIHQSFYSFYYSASSYGSNNRLFIEPLTASNDVLASNSSGNFAYPFALAQNSVISSSQSFWRNEGYSSGVQSLNYASCSFGNFCSTDAYIGVRFNIGAGNTHYGWIRLEVLTDIPDSWTIKEFAYNSVADASILAGQQTLSTANAIIKAIRVVALNKSISMYNLPTQTNYRLYDMSGKTVLQGSTSQKIDTIEANTVASGVFILEIEDVNTKVTTRKKLVL